MTNSHAVDQLVAIRAQMSALKESEDLLKVQISREMGDDKELVGDFWIAIQNLTTRKGGLDEKALIAAGIDVDAFRKPETTVHSIRTVLLASRAAA